MERKESRSKAEELINQLKLYKHYTVYKLVNLDSCTKRGIAQITTYDNVGLEWGGRNIKFWCDCKNGFENSLLLNADEVRVEPCEPEQGREKISIHINNCPERVTIFCDK